MEQSLTDAYPVKKRGRPKQSVATNQPVSSPSSDKPDVKKGRKSWKPASLNVVENKQDGFRYRWVRKDKTNIAKKKREGWEEVSDMTDPGIVHESAGRMTDGTPLTTVRETHDQVLMRLDEDTAQGRDEYHNQRNAARMSGLKQHAQKEMSGAFQGTGIPQVHGNVTIKRGREVTVID